MSDQAKQTHRNQLRILKVHLGWLQRLIYRGRGLRPLMKKIACNAFWFQFAHRYSRRASYSVLILVTEWRLPNRLQCRILALIFRKPTRVSHLSWFPETPTIYEVLCTHNTTRFVLNKCANRTMHFALYTQSEYKPTMRMYPDEALYTK